MHRALEHVGFTLGGEAGSRSIRCPGMSTGPETPLRLIRAALVPVPVNRASSGWATAHTSVACATTVASPTWSGTA